LPGDCRDEESVDDLVRAYDRGGPQAMLERAVTAAYSNDIAMTSSFGVESAVLLHMVASVGVQVPIFFVDTGVLFDETIRYKDQLVRRLDLRAVHVVRADPAAVAATDRDGVLFRADPDLCCEVRKVAPLRATLDRYTAWISGRKRMHGADRAGLAPVERTDRHVKINPLWDWDTADIDEYMRRHDLPPHTLEGVGFTSVGCRTCTSRTEPHEERRAGRWRGRPKTECGIHHLRNGAPGPGYGPSRGSAEGR